MTRAFIERICLCRVINSPLLVFHNFGFAGSSQTNHIWKRQEKQARKIVCCVPKHTCMRLSPIFLTSSPISGHCGRRQSRAAACAEKLEVVALLSLWKSLCVAERCLTRSSGVEPVAAQRSCPCCHWATQHKSQKKKFRGPFFSVGSSRLSTIFSA